MGCSDAARFHFPARSPIVATPSDATSLSCETRSTYSARCTVEKCAYFRTISTHSQPQSSCSTCKGVSGLHMPAYPGMPQVMSPETLDARPLQRQPPRLGIHLVGAPDGPGSRAMRFGISGFGLYIPRTRPPASRPINNLRIGFGRGDRHPYRDRWDNDLVHR